MGFSCQNFMVRISYDSGFDVHAANPIEALGFVNPAHFRASQSTWGESLQGKISPPKIRP